MRKKKKRKERKKEKKGEKRRRRREKFLNKPRFSCLIVFNELPQRSLMGISYQCHQRAGTAAAKPPWRPAEWEMRIGRRAPPPCRSAHCAGALRGAENAPASPLIALQPLSGLLLDVTIYLEAHMEPRSSGWSTAIHHRAICETLLVNRSPPPVFFQPHASSSTSPTLNSTHTHTHTHTYMEAHAEMINISPWERGSRLVCPTATQNL